jgi:hypothetical protein
MREFNVDIKKIWQNGKHDNYLIFKRFYGLFQSDIKKVCIAGRQFFQLCYDGNR